MHELSETQLSVLKGGETAWTLCGIATGATLGASLLFGGMGFALTVNKALAFCTLAVLT